MFQSRIVKTDVTAIKIIQNQDIILAGVGGCLHVFNINNTECIKKYEVFQGENICNIIPNKKHRVIIVSGQSVKILESTNFLIFKETVACRFPEWILTLEWINQDEEIAAVLMHNKMQIWNQKLEVKMEKGCEEQCILYSAHIYKNTELFVFSGTVFSEILIWKPTHRDIKSCILKRLQGHKGVIFSLDYNADAGFLCSTSDDRTAILWKLDKGSFETTDFGKLQVPAIQVSGHLSRIFRCRVLNNYFVTAGEDSILNIWSMNGKLHRKIETHQGGSVWSLDCDPKHNLIVTGGGDCGVTAFPIDINFYEEKLKLPNEENPKTIGILKSKNLVAFSETGALYYLLQKQWLRIEQHDDLKNYVLVQVSKCRNLVSLSGFHGQLYIYAEEEERKKLMLISVYRTQCKSRIFSFHWLTCQTFLICQEEGILTLFYLKQNIIVPIKKFVLPQSKERWSTTALTVQNYIIVGDRKGHLHLFDIDKKGPIQTLKKVHNHLGVTHLLLLNKFIISLGRDSTLKTFALLKNNLMLISSDKLRFSWLVNIYENLMAAFSSNNFLIWDLKTKRVLFEKDCGGGHRSWDFYRNWDNLTFAYIKDKIINVTNFKLSTILPLDYIEGYHVKEVNAMQVLRCYNSHILISGGEDTFLRLDFVKDSRFKNLLKLKSHLSSIRAITTYAVDADNEKEVYLVCSAGGRAQIICWKLEILPKSNCFPDVYCSEQHSYYKIIDSEESEMRIMDVIITEIGTTPVLFCACSDGIIKVFYIGEENGIYKISFCRNIFYKLKCIMKIICFKIFDSCILVSLATDGKLVFWNMNTVLTDDQDISTFAKIQANQSGINSCSHKFVDKNVCLILTGGDDNSVIGNLLEFSYKNNKIDVKKIDRFVDCSTHCAQITGIFLSDTHFITASIDQRITVFSWVVLDNKMLDCQLVSKYNTSISDIHGLQCCKRQNKFDLFIYGNGIEFLEIE